jgi:ribosome-binding protein aMBF1 (putative translation factor)
MICDDCALHYGNADKTAVAHDRMMTAQRDLHAMAMERLDDKRAALAIDLARAQQQIEELSGTIASDYTTRLGGDVQTVVETAVVADAMSRENTARKARDRAMGVVFSIAELHHEDRDTCSCSKPITQCEEFRALSGFRDEYSRWENKQIELLTLGKHHGLPYNHPRARGMKSWEWKGLPSSVPERNR